MAAKAVWEGDILFDYLHLSHLWHFLLAASTNYGYYNYPISGGVLTPVLRRIKTAITSAGCICVSV
jgi:hypothetical protein